MAQGRKFSDEKASILRKEYESGATLQKLVDKHGSDRSTISRVIVRAGGKMRTQKAAQKTSLPRDQWPALREKYEAGSDLRELASLYNINHTTVQRYILASGGKMRKGGGKGRKRIVKTGILSWLNTTSYSPNCKDETVTIHFDSSTREMYETDFARLFDQKNKHWDPTLLSNALFLEIQERYFRDLLAARGHLFLNEVYDALDFPRIPQGQLIGWHHSDERSVKLGLTMNIDGSILIKPNVISSNVIYHKI